jgi:hypothetical protein
LEEKGKEPIREFLGVELLCPPLPPTEDEVYITPHREDYEFTSKLELFPERLRLLPSQEKSKRTRRSDQTTRVCFLLLSIPLFL